MPLPAHNTARFLFHAAGFVALLIVLALLARVLNIPPGEPGNVLDAYGHQLLLDVGIAITLAVSLNLILGMTGQFSLGHAGFLAAGAYTSLVVTGEWFPPQLAFLTQSLHLSPINAFSVIMFIGMLAGAAVAAFLGLIIGIPTLRLRGDYLAIATLGFSEILVVLVQNLPKMESFFGIPLGRFSIYLGGATGLSLNSLRSEWVANQPNADAPFVQMVSTYNDSMAYYVGFFWVYALAVLCIYVVHNIKYATSGRALLAIREDPIASESVGIPTTRYKVTAFVIGAALAGAAGSLLGHHKSLVNPESFRFMRSIEIVTIVILGGQGSITGSVVAAVVLTTLPEYLRTRAWVDPEIIEKWRMPAYALFIILAMLFRPQGLFARYEISDLFRWFLRRGRKPVAPPPPAAVAPTANPRFKLPSKLPDSAVVLEARHVGMSFGGLCAVDDFNLQLQPRELVGLIGPNGAGKTTVFNLLTGVYRPTRGAIFFQERPITATKPHRISRAGIARTFQNIRLFAHLSVLDNVMIAQHAHHRQGIPAAILRTPPFYAEEAHTRKVAHELLGLFHLDALAGEQASSLSYGDQRRLEIARALGTRPRLLLLDEPAAGMNPTEKRQLMDLIRHIRNQFDLTILLIEHDMKVVMGVCQRIVVLDYGKTIAAGTPEEIRKNPAVIEAYLGASAKQG